MSEVVATDWCVPSTRKCAACGCVGAKKALSVWIGAYVTCSVTHDRDADAAQNLLAASYEVRAGSQPRRWPVKCTLDTPSLGRSPGESGTYYIRAQADASSAPTNPPPVRSLA